MTISIGVAIAPTVGIGDVTELIRAADAALYEAKRQGRNRSVVFGSVGADAKARQVMTIRGRRSRAIGLSARLALASLGTAIAIGVVCAVGLSSLENTAAVTRVAVTPAARAHRRRRRDERVPVPKRVRRRVPAERQPRVARRARDQPPRLRILVGRRAREDRKSGVGEAARRHPARIRRLRSGAKDGNHAL